MTYMRVMPRDLFNESKLLKCIGKVALMMHEGKFPGLIMHHDTSENQGFTVDQDKCSSDLYIRNLFFQDQENEPIEFFTKYNSKENWPLMMQYKDQDYHVFGEDGTFLPTMSIFKV